MKFIIPPVLLVLLLPIYSFSQNTTAQTDSITKKLELFSKSDWLSADKGHHLAASAFITGIAFYSFKQELGYSSHVSNTAAISTALVVGITKEIYDKVSNRGHPSFKDILANIAGITVSLIILNISIE